MSCRSRQNANKLPAPGDWLGGAIVWHFYGLLGHRVLFPLRSQHVSCDKQNIGRTFTQTPHEIRIPFRAERYVNAHAPSVTNKLLLEVTADAVQHLKFKRISRNIFASREGLCLADDLFVVCRQTMMDPALHQRLH